MFLKKILQNCALMCFIILADFCGTVFALNGNLAGSGNEASPWLIEDIQDFVSFSADSSYWAQGKFIRLVTDIDGINQVYTTAVIAPDMDISDGIFQGQSFRAHFDANGHTIRNVTINSSQSTNFLGIFGKIDRGTVKNLTLENVSVSGGEFSSYVAALVGLNNSGVISNCHVSGTIDGLDFVAGLVGYNDGGSISDCLSVCVIHGKSGSWYLGGLVGYNSFNGNISRSSSSAQINSDVNSLYVGGLAGGNYGTISMCISTARTVCGTGSQKIGGLTGESHGNVNNCFASGPVLGTGDTVGGLAGYTFYGMLDRSYSAAVVSGSQSVGGLVGSNYENYGGITRCFWDVNESGTSVSAGGDGLTTAIMKKGAVYLQAGWDFFGESANGRDEIWFMPTQSHPVLNFNAQHGFNLQHFIWFSQSWLTTQGQVVYNSSWDLYPDGNIDFKDLAVFCSLWLNQ